MFIIDFAFFVKKFEVLLVLTEGVGTPQSARVVVWGAMPSQMYFQAADGARK